MVEDFYHTMYQMLETTGLNLHWITPENITQMDSVLKEGIYKLHYNRSMREVDWLKENGMCLDNLNVGPSLIPQAGRGAFAKRRMSKDSVIAPVPLIHIADRKLLTMYAERPHGVMDPLRPVHRQLLLNYCMGHRDSDLLLCPYGVGTALINHSLKPNVRLEWSTKLTTKPEWWKLPLSEWSGNTTAGLTMQLVAERDIEKGEELYLDYGHEWQEAWNQHVATWQPPVGRRAQDLNNDPDLVLDLGVDSLDDNKLYCRDYYLKKNSGYNAGGIDDEFFNPQYMCRVIDRQEIRGSLRYMVEFGLASEKDEEQQCDFEDWKISFGLPRDAFFFIPTKALGQSWSFRHDIRLPDKLFPDSWKRERIA